MTSHGSPLPPASLSETRRDVFGFGAFLNGERDLSENGFVGDRGDVIGEAALEGGFKGLFVEQCFAAEFGN